MTFEANSRRACYADNRARFNYPASVAWVSALRRVETIAIRREEHENAKANLETFWAGLGKVEPKRYSDTGEELARLRDLSRRALGNLTAVTCYRENFARPRSYNTPQNGPGEVYCENPESAFRVDIITDSGYYTHPDMFDDENTVRPAVVTLTGRKGKSRCMPAIAWGHDDGGLVIDFAALEVSDSLGADWEKSDAWRDAKRAADAWAKSEAKKECEYQTAWQAGSMWSELGEEVAELNKEAMSLTKEARAASRMGACEFPALVQAIRDKVTDIRRDVWEKRDLRAALKEGDGGRFDLWFYAGEKRLQEAFNEGAGEDVFAI